MSSKLETSSLSASRGCIFRSPSHIRERDTKAYTPQVLHWSTSQRKRRLQCDGKAQKNVSKRFSRRSQVSLENFIEVIMKSETRLRSCYAETIKLSSDDLVEMIILDAAFIIMFLCELHFTDFSRSTVLVFNEQKMNTNMVCLIFRDMSLLENQLPFFILEEMVEQSSIFDNDSKISMIKLTHLLSRVAWGPWVPTDILQKLESCDEVQHFVDLLRICRQPSTLAVQKQIRTVTVPTVTELKQVGVKFRASESNENEDEITFRHGILNIAPFVMDVRTHVLWKNLVAFEQCHCAENYVNDYLAIISRLIRSPKDVEILRENEILDFFLPNSEVESALFHHINLETVISCDNFFFSALIHDLNEYYRKPWNRWKATLRQDYFNTPWSTLSVIAAVLLLLLTLIQTVFSILQVVL